MELWIKENNYKAVRFSDLKSFTNINNLSELAKIETENN
jgi:molybdopterin-guanine dinucleotide biosynthesis protein A